MRKYVNYIVATDFDEETTSDYREALSLYRKAESATLYGTDFDMNMSIIFSK